MCQADTVSFCYLNLEEFLFFTIETLSSRYFGLLMAVLQSRLPLLSKVEAQLDPRIGIKPAAPCGAVDG